MLAPDLWRIGALGVAASLAVLALAAASVWREHRAVARHAADAAVQFVDARMDAVADELARLQSDVPAEPADAPCPQALRAALVRASLSSMLVQRFMVGPPGGGDTCHPDGPGPAFDLPQPAQSMLALYSTGEIASRLRVTHSPPDGRIWVMLLDPRAFDLHAASMRPWDAPQAVRIRLMSADGRRLARLDRAAPDEPLLPALRAVSHSQRHALRLEANVPTAALLGAGLQRALAALAGLWLVLGTGLVLAWRRTVLRSRLRHRIAQGLRKRQFEPYVQPIVDLASGQCVGAEVLMRWAHPQRGVLAPGEFIEEAERTGLIVGMSQLVMQRAAHRLASVAAAWPHLYFSFNVTPTQLRQPRFAQALGELFRADTLAREQVLLELTEREFVDPQGVRVLGALRESGWRIAIDDFGTGHSSLASLEQMPIDRIKIDRAFVGSIGAQTVNRPVLDSIIQMAERLNVRLIAEGVETQAQWDYLAARGVQCAQGYLIARPMAIPAFVQWLAGQPGAASVSAAGAARAPVQRSASVDALALRLWQHMRTPGGLDIRERIHRLRSYPRCFVGREAVDWLVRHQRIDRDEAVRLGRHLAALGLLAHVLDEHDFEDAELFYRLLSPDELQAAAAPAAEDLRAALIAADGPVLAQHARGLVRHARCACGRDIVDWLVKRYGVPRATGVQWASSLMRQGALRHVFDDQPFRDDRSLYRPV